MGMMTMGVREHLWCTQESASKTRQDSPPWGCPSLGCIDKGAFVAIRGAVAARSLLRLEAVAANLLLSAHIAGSLHPASLAASLVVGLLLVIVVVIVVHAHEAILRAARHVLLSLSRSSRHFACLVGKGRHVLALESRERRVDSPCV